MARAITAPELAKLRSEGQFAISRLVVDAPVAVFKARVNQAFTSWNNVAQVTFDTVTLGAYTAVLEGMTVWVGTSDGAYDVGTCRVRKAAGAATLYIGAESEIEWADDQYLTVVDERRLWPKRAYTDTAEETFIDWDVDYSDQHSAKAPVAVLGPDWVVELTGATVDVTPDASDSWVIDSAIASYLWTATGASATADLNTATPTMTYNAAGRYWISCTVTADNGKSSTGWRNVYVVSAASPGTTQFTLDSLGANEQGWRMSVTLYDEALLSEIRERTKVILYAQEWCAGVAGSMGPVSGRENVKFIGWIGEETIRDDPRVGSVSFDVWGTAEWLGALAGQAFTLSDTYFEEGAGGAPTKWEKFLAPDVDDALWHLLHWRSTATAVVDVILSGDARMADHFSLSRSSLLQQADEIGGKIFATPRSDRYGRLYVEIDAQMVPEASRGTIPTVHALLTQDWRERISLLRQDLTQISLVELTGLAYSLGESATIGSRAPGDMAADYGSDDTLDEILATTQAQINQLAGLYWGWKNCEYPSTPVDLASNHWFIDIAPRQYASMSIASGDTQRGITWTTVKLLPREIEVSYDHETGVVTPTVTFEQETFEGPSVTMVIPGEGGGGIEPPVEPPVEPPEPPVPPGPTPDPGPTPADAVVATADDVRITTDLDVASPTWTSCAPSATAIIDADLSLFSNDEYYVLEEDALWITQNLTDGAAATWTKCLDAADYTADLSGLMFMRVRCSSIDGMVYVLGVDASNDKAVCFHTANRGGTWNWDEITTTIPGLKTYSVTRIPTLGPVTSETYEGSATIERLTGLPLGIAAWWHKDELPAGNLDTWGGFRADGTTVYEGDPVYGDGASPSTYVLKCRQNTLSSKSYVYWHACVDDYFGVAVPDMTSLWLNMPDNAGLTAVKWGYIRNLWEGRYHTMSFDCWVFWDVPSYVGPRVLDVARTNGKWVYVGLADKIMKSEDGGYTWAEVTAEGTYDLVVDPQAAGVIYYWDDDGNLEWCIAKSPQAGLLTETAPYNQPVRLARQPNAGTLWTIDGDGNLKKRELAIWSTQKSSISGGLGLRAYLGSATRLVFLDNTKVWYSGDAGGNFVDKTGGWATFGDGVSVHLMREA